MRNTVSGEKNIFYDPATQRVSDRWEDFATNQAAINPEAVYDFLLYGTILPPNSIYQGTYSLFPGQEVSFGNGQPALANPTYNRLAHLQVKHEPIDWFVDRLDEIFTDYFAPYRTAADRVALFLSGGIDSAIIASYLPKATVCATWAGWGEGGTDLTFARQSFATYELAAHLVEHVDFARDLPLYLKTLEAVKQPFAFSFGAPYLRLAETLSRHFAGQQYHLFVGQNADTITGAFRPTVHSYYFSKINRYNPICYLPIKKTVYRRRRKYFLLTSKNPVELLAFFHSCGLYPGPWLAVGPGYFKTKINQLEQQLGKKIRRFSDLILVDELMTEARRNQLVQNYLPGLYNAQVHLPYYDQRVIELLLQVPQRIRRQNHFGKEILRRLAHKRGVPSSVIEKGKKGLAYGNVDFIKRGQHVAIWEQMVGHKTLNQYLDVPALRAARQDDFNVFDRVSSLYYYLHVVVEKKKSQRT